MEPEQLPEPELLVAEYNALRAESLNAKQNQQTIFQWSLAAMGAVFAALAVLAASPGSILVGYAFVVPLVATTGFMSWLGEVERMERAGRFIRNREQAVQRGTGTLVGDPDALRVVPILWESVLFDDRYRREYGKNRIGSLAAILLYYGSFLGSMACAFTIVDDAGARSLDVPVWAVRAVIAAASVAFVVFFTRRLRSLQLTSTGRLATPSSAEYQGERSVDLILPCLNESLALPWVLSRVPANVGVIVSDDGSSDDTARLAQQYGHRVVSSATRRGVGAATKAGIRSSTADLVVVMDGDGSVDPADILTLLGPLVDGSATAVFGSRLGDRRSLGIVRRRLIGAKQWYARLVRCPLPVEDLGSTHAFDRGALEDATMAVLSDGGAWSLDLALALSDVSTGRRVVSVELPFHRRIGASKISGSLVGAVSAAVDVVRALHARPKRTPSRSAGTPQDPPAT